MSDGMADNARITHCESPVAGPALLEFAPEVTRAMVFGFDFNAVALVLSLE